MKNRLLFLLLVIPCFIGAFICLISTILGWIITGKAEPYNWYMSNVLEKVFLLAIK